MEGVKEANTLTVTYSGQGTMQVLTDLPGGTVAARRNLTLPATGAERKTETFSLLDGSGEYLLGKLFGEQAVGGGSGLILHGGYYMMRRVGTYVAAGETWKSQPLDI